MHREKKGTISENVGGLNKKPKQRAFIFLLLNVPQATIYIY